MEEVIPLFKSHYSLGRAILTLDMPKEFTDDRSDTVFDIVDDITPELKDIFLVEDSMAGFLEAYTNAKELKKKLIFGLRLTFCPDSLEKSEEGRKNSYKNIIFIKNEAGYKQLIKIYTYAAQDGFYYEPRLDFKKLKEFWTDDLILGIPFYDSFLYNNKYTDSQCIPDFSFNNPVFLIENNDTLLDKDMGEAVEKFCEGKYETVKAQSVYYRRDEDFGAYMTARCINKRTTTEKPNLDGMCSDQFSIEAWCKKTGSKITGKPRRAIEEEEEPKKEPTPAAVYTESGLDCDTSKGKLFEGLEPDINRIAEKYLGFKVVKDTGRSLRAKTAPSDGVVYKDGKRIGTNESKVRVYAKKPKPFTEAYVKTEGYLLSCHKIEKKYSKFHNSRDGLADTAKKRKEDAYVFVLIPFEQKLMVVDLYKEGKQVRKYEYTEQIVTKRTCNATKEEAIPNFIIDVKDALFIKFELEDLSKKGQEIYKQVLNPDVH